MIVRVENQFDGSIDMCLLEFQGEIVGELAGNELGKITVAEVQISNSNCGQIIMTLICRMATVKWKLDPIFWRVM